LASNTIAKYRLYPWQITVCATICGYLAMSAATQTLRSFHWFMLLVIPIALFNDDRVRRFFVDWLPLFAFWIVYDRLRLLQPYLLDRVAVAWPYHLEQWAFGWLCGGEAPAHAARLWLASQVGTLHWAILSWSAQIVYLSHLFVLPLILIYFWFRGLSRQHQRGHFIAFMRGFAALHLLAIAVYLMLPVAPPWWISLHGVTQPTSGLVAATSMTTAMDGVIVQGLIKSASHWFAAVPSLHGAYPVLMLLLSFRTRSKPAMALLALYVPVMFAATVVLNQHYIIDLLAGSVLALIAAWYSSRQSPAQAA
jgi:inositol phosphorylceramide synthase catalytic subunit